MSKHDTSRPLRFLAIFLRPIYKLFLNFSCKRVLSTTKQQVQRRRSAALPRFAEPDLSTRVFTRLGAGGYWSVALWCIATHPASGLACRDDACPKNVSRPQNIFLFFFTPNTQSPSATAPTSSTTRIPQPCITHPLLTNTSFSLRTPPQSPLPAFHHCSSLSLR